MLCPYGKRLCGAVGGCNTEVYSCWSSGIGDGSVDEGVIWRAFTSVEGEESRKVIGGGATWTYIVKGYVCMRAPRVIDVGNWFVVCVRENSY